MSRYKIYVMEKGIWKILWLKTLWERQTVFPPSFSEEIPTDISNETFNIVCSYSPKSYISLTRLGKELRLIQLLPVIISKIIDSVCEPSSYLILSIAEVNSKLFGLSCVSNTQSFSSSYNSYPSVRNHFILSNRDY